MLPDVPSAEQVAEAVEAYNRKFGVEDKRLWALAQKTIQELQSSGCQASAEGFVWAVRRWGSIQGARSSYKTAMARALVDLQIPRYTVMDRDICVQLWMKLVTLAQHHGVERRESSWASKILHWLLPHQVPIYDAFVRRYLGEGNREGELAYRTIVMWEYMVADKLTPVRDQVVGEIEPRTLLRAIDKFVWWESGGKNRQHPEVSAALRDQAADATSFIPIDIKGEPLSATVLRDRR